jgi:hypothetical protein
VEELGYQRGQQAQRDNEDAPQDTGTPPQAQAQVAFPVRRHESTAAVDDDDLLRRDDGDHRRGGHPP